jgi:hypothetical protein
MAGVREHSLTRHLERRLAVPVLACCFAAALIVAALAGAGSVSAGTMTRPLPAALSLVWSTPIEGPETDDLEPLFVRGEALILGSAEFGWFRAVDLRSHRLLWQRGGGGHSLPDPLGATDVLTTSDEDKPAIVRISGRTGKPRWRADLPAPMDELGYFARAGDIGGIVYFKPGRPCTTPDRYSPQSYGSAVIDLRNGKRVRLAHPIPDLPLLLDLDVPRFLSVRPALSQQDPTGPGRDVTLACYDAMTGRALWTAKLAAAKGQVGEPFTYWARWPLGLSLARLAGPAQGLALSWVDLSTGAVLRRDVVPESDAGHLGYVVIAEGKPAAPVDAHQLLARARWLYRAGGRLLLVDPAKPKTPERVWDWAAFLPEGAELDGPFWWEATRCIAWPFLTIRYYQPQGGIGGVLLINLQTGTVHRAEGWSGIVDLKRGLLYTTTESRLFAYRLPPKRQR